MNEELTPEERWQRSPRPLSFVRIRLSRAQAEWLRDLLEDEQEDLFDQLGKLRSEGRPESDPEIEECRTSLTHLIYIHKDCSTGLIELVGPDTR